VGGEVATQRLTVYLLRGINDADDALAKDKTHTKVSVDPAMGLSGYFYYVSTPPRTPGWVSYIRGVAPQLPTLSSSSASGLLIVEAHDHYFALTFGYGRSLLDLSKIEPQFGLKVALNRIDPTQLRSLDTKTFEDLVVTRTTQTSKSTELPTFGIDISSDILRAVTGEPRDPSLSKKLSGADPLVLGTTRSASGLPNILAEILAAHAEETYKDNFAWIDHLSLVGDTALIDLLDTRLAGQLAAGDTGGTHMAMPETLNWEEIEAFKITGSQTLFDDLDLDEYLTALGQKRSDITVSKLKGRRVAVKFTRSGDTDGRWTLYNCLVSEQRVDGQLYVLIEGRWLAVSDTLAEEVDAFARSLPASRTNLLDSNAGEVERDYNQRMATEPTGNLLLLDAKIAVPGGASSGIEFCDLLSSDGELIHIKRKSRSSTLSHLFAQGQVSANTFLGDGTFRDRVRQRIEEVVPPALQDKWLALVPGSANTVDRSKYSVSYAVIANSEKSGADWLPFFSKLNLMQQGRQILSLGFKLSISRISVTQ
jgi:uncharacterized protein (TIGR04141 family)